MDIIKIILVALIVGIIILQKYLSKKENKWLGLILPVITFISSIGILIYPFYLMQTEPSLSYVLSFAVFIFIFWFIVGIILTNGLISMYFHYQGIDKKQFKKDMVNKIKQRLKPKTSTQKKVVKTIALILAVVMLVVGAYGINSYAKYQNTTPRTWWETSRDSTKLSLYFLTPTWDLAMAVNFENTEKIAEILEENPELADHKENRYDKPLLIWAIYHGKIESVEALLKGGADPNIICTYSGETPLTEVFANRYNRFDEEGNIELANLLLEYGADPNSTYQGSSTQLSYSRYVGQSVLMDAIDTGSLDAVKLLIEYGADPNYQVPSSGKTAFMKALPYDLDIAHYLAIELDVAIGETYKIAEVDGRLTYENTPYQELLPKNQNYSEITVSSLLKQMVYPLNSEEYKKKMEIVEVMESQGVEYIRGEPYSDTIRDAKKMYPDTWEEYLKVY